MSAISYAVAGVLLVAFSANVIAGKMIGAIGQDSPFYILSDVHEFLLLLVICSFFTLATLLGEN